MCLTSRAQQSYLIRCGPAENPWGDATMRVGSTDTNPCARTAVIEAIRSGREPNDPRRFRWFEVTVEGKTLRFSPEFINRQPGGARLATICFLSHFNPTEFFLVQTGRLCTVHADMPVTPLSLLEHHPVVASFVHLGDQAAVRYTRVPEGFVSEIAHEPINPHMTCTVSEVLAMAVAGLLNSFTLFYERRGPTFSSRVFALHPKTESDMDLGP